MGLRKSRASVSFAAVVFACLALAPASAQATSWGTATNYAPPGGMSRPLSVATGNFNGDANTDFVLGDDASGTIAAFLGNGSGSFTWAGNTDSGAFGGNAAIAVGQFNADSSADLVVAGRQQGTRLMLGNGSGGFSSGTFVGSNAAYDVAVGQLDGDTNADFATVDGSNFVSVSHGNGSGGFGAATNISLGGTPAGVTVGNFNGDANLDLAVSRSSGQTIAILLGTGGGAFGAPTNFSTPGINPGSIQTGDLNGDGNADLVFCGGFGGGVSVMLGNGLGSFSGPTTYPTDTGHSDVVITDVNGDTKPDLAVTSENAGTISVLLGDGTGGFAPRVGFPAPSGPIGLATGLFNGDSTPDFVTAANGGARVLLSVVPTLSITAPNGSVFQEGDTGTRNFPFTVNASSPSVDPVTVDVETMDHLATAASGDYVPLPLQTLTFAPGQTSKPVTAQGNGDFNYEPDEDFFVKLSNSTNATIAADTGQAIMLNDDQIGYARAKAATPLSIPLVPAFNKCNAPDRQHAPPIDYPSCSIPTQRSSWLTVGTPDANGEAANSVASVTYTVLPGNPSTPADEADVGLRVSITDVRDKLRLSDYIAELWATTSLRITDRNQSQPTTTTDIPFGFAIPCVATADTTIGATCSVNTTADSLIPGAVPEGPRSVWQTGAVQVQDGGEDGEGATTGDNTLFLTQGIFVP